VPDVFTGLLKLFTKREQEFFHEKVVFADRRQSFANDKTVRLRNQQSFVDDAQRRIHNRESLVFECIFSNKYQTCVNIGWPTNVLFVMSLLVNKWEVYTLNEQVHHFRLTGLWGHGFVGG
jgi:hypothetical protein